MSAILLFFFSMSVFRFKRFSVRNEKSAMKVNSDGVLLGAAVQLDPSIARVLDVGTGTGTIALILAQRLEHMLPCAAADLRITGIDIDPPSAQEAAENFSASPWSGVLKAELSDLAQWRAPDGGYDLIISNPPYFDNSLLNPDPRETAARHSISLSYRELAEFAQRALSPSGRLALILPSDCEKALTATCRRNGLRLSRLTYVRTSERKAPKRIICEFVHAGAEGGMCPLQDTLTVGSDQYWSIVGDFYLDR